MTVEDIMIPRNEVSGLDLEENIDILMEQILSCEYTRQPVYSGDINNVIGIFHVRKANHLLRAETITHKAIKRFADETYLFLSTKLTTQLLNFKKMRSRFAIVVDDAVRFKGLLP